MNYRRTDSKFIKVDGRRLQRAARKLKRRRAHTLTLAGIPIAPLDETKHFKLIGITESGKSTALREVLRTALQKGGSGIDRRSRRRLSPPLLRPGPR
jgi:hypothetical protein